jgi:hypothetical protein
MAYAIVGPDPTPFRPLFGLSDAELAAHGAIRYVADARPGFPCRISLVDAATGETLLLLNHTDLPGATPYRSSHAIFVREAAGERAIVENAVPDVLRTRLLSIRAFDSQDMMTDADVVPGAAAEATIVRLFADPRVARLHVHNAKRGCYAASVERR